MCRIKYFSNSSFPKTREIKKKLDGTGIDYSILPTSGPLTLWVDGLASYGPKSVNRTLDNLIENKAQFLNPD